MAGPFRTAEPKRGQFFGVERSCIHNEMGVEVVRLRNRVVRLVDAVLPTFDMLAPVGATAQPRHRRLQRDDLLTKGRVANRSRESQVESRLVGCAPVDFATNLRPLDSSACGAGTMSASGMGGAGM